MKIKIEQTDCKDCKTFCKSVFCNLNKENQEMLNQSKQLIFFPKDQVINYEGVYPHNIQCVNNGLVKTSKLDYDGNEQISKLTGNGDILDCHALISGEKYFSSAIAVIDSAICLIPKETFLKLKDSDEKLSTSLFNQTSRELNFAIQKSSNLVEKYADERIAEALLYMVQIGGLEEDGKTINFIMKRLDIASLAGVADKTGISLLSDLVNDEIIEYVGHKIKIINYQKLVKHAKMAA